MAKFKSVGGGHVQVFFHDRPSLPINIDEGGFYETDDKDEIQALKDSPEVEAVGTEQQSESRESRKRA